MKRGRKKPATCAKRPPDFPPWIWESLIEHKIKDQRVRDQCYRIIYFDVVGGMIASEIPPQWEYFRRKVKYNDGPMIPNAIMIDALGAIGYPDPRARVLGDKRGENKDRRKK